MWQIRKADVLDTNSTASESAKKALERHAADTDYIDLKVELHRRLIDLINLSALETMTRPQIET
ncbi:MAG TPA: CpaF family protein, partial [Sphingorhabdus sp.]|nr:CpaF family protein [Sphingorhabdus sp.]